MKFDYSRNYKELDLRAHPELYAVGVGEQGVLLVEPYKSELLPHWRFATPDAARQSSETLYQMFLDYKARQDFVGMDMARKFLQMGYTRSKRYANHKSGQKYVGPVPEGHKGQSGAWGRETAPREEDPVKAECATIFYAKWQQAKEDPEYQRLMARHRELYSGQTKL